MSRLVPMFLLVTVLAVTAIWFSSRPSMQVDGGGLAALCREIVIVAHAQLRRHAGELWQQREFLGGQRGDGYDARGDCEALG